MTRAERIASLLRDRFAPVHLEVRDDSARHAGHAGATDAGETHFHVTMISAAFAGQTRLACARAVHAALDREFAGGLHALSLRLQAPAGASSAPPSPGKHETLS